MALWKDVEREHARRLNTDRVGPQGKNTVDSFNKWLAVESKERKKLPKWLKSALTQVYLNRPKDGIGRLLVAVLHEKGGRYDDDIVCMRLKDFEDWFVGTEALDPHHPWRHTDTAEKPDHLRAANAKENTVPPSPRRLSEIEVEVREFREAERKRLLDPPLGHLAQAADAMAEFLGLEQYSKFKGIEVDSRNWGDTPEEDQTDE